MDSQIPALLRQEGTCQAIPVMDLTGQDPVVQDTCLPALQGLTTMVIAYAILLSDSWQ